MQLTLKFDAGLVEGYSTCREYVGARVHQQRLLQKQIAADMDYSPSTLSRKLAQNPDDTQRFTLDDLELYIQTTNDTQPVFYLVEKYLSGVDEDELRRQIQTLQDQLASKGRAAN